jgi:hypothetical protein
MPSSLPSDTRLRLIAESYQRLTGKPLLPTISPLPLAGEGAGERVALSEAMWNAPFAIVAHGTEADPIFFYGNRYALQHFEMSFEEFAQLPSRLSAEPVAQEAREKALTKVAQQGYIDGYSGMRVAKSGHRFMITDCTIWNLLDAQGAYHGQAAIFVAQEQDPNKGEAR